MTPKCQSITTIICIGDFNYDWLSPEKSETKKLSELANMFQLEQFIKEPTRITCQTRKKSVKTGSANFYNAYKKARNELNSLIKSTKDRYYNDALNQCKKDPKAMWKSINQLTNKNQRRQI